MKIVVLIVYIIFAILEFIPLYKKKQKKELYLYIPMMSVALIICLLINMNVKLLSPAKVIESMVNMIIGE